MTDIPPVRFPAATQGSRQPPVLTNLLRSEWAKLASVRSTYWSLLVAAAALIPIGIGAAIGIATSHTHNAGFDAVSNNLSGVVVAQLAIAVLWALAVTSEYSSGMIRTTFTAAPQREMVITTKAAVFAAAVFGIGTTTGFATSLVGQAILCHRWSAWPPPAPCEQSSGSACT